MGRRANSVPAKSAWLLEASWPWGVRNPPVSHPRTAIPAGLRLAAAVREDGYPVRWAGQQAVVTLPEQIDVSNAGQIREELLTVINRGAAELIADMTATISCDHAGADALARAYQRAVLAGTQLRLVVSAQIVRRVLAISGLDRLISIYPSLESATAAPTPAAALRLPGRVPADGHAPPDGRARIAGQRRQAGPAGGPAAAVPAVIWKLLDALDDGVALAGRDGILTLASRRLEDMFGYQRGELPGRSVESLVPADLQDGHRRHRASYARAPTARPMGAGVRLVGQRKDGTTFPVQVSLAPLPTTDGRFTLAVIRDLTQTGHLEDLADLARAAAAAEQEHRGQELLDRIVGNLFSAGLSLQAAINEPDEVARQAIGEAVQGLDDTIRQIRDHLFTTRRQAQPPPSPPGRAR